MNKENMLTEIRKLIFMYSDIALLEDKKKLIKILENELIILKECLK